MTDGSRQRRPRVLMVSRYFWPLGCFDGAVHLMAIARGLSECGFHVDVLTPKYHTEWAESFRFRDISVYRPVRAPKVGWKKAFDRGTTRYIDFLTQWLLSHGGGYDVLYCDSAREEAISTVAAAKELGLKCMVRVAGLGTASDLEWMNSSRFGKRIVGALSLADLVVVGDADAERSWHTFGIRGPKLARIRSGVYPSELEDKQDLRSAFARINGDLFVPSGSQVALSVERHDASSGVMQLANAAVGLSREAPSLHYWFVGDGANRDAVYSRLRGDGLRQSFVMPGSFGLIQDVFQAADFLIQTGEAGFDALVPAAIEAGLPIVLANNAAARSCLDVAHTEPSLRLITRREADPLDFEMDNAGSLVSWFEPSRPSTLRFAILQLLAHPELALKRADCLRQLWLRNRSGRSVIEAYASFIRKLSADSRTTRHSAGLLIDSERAS